MSISKRVISQGVATLQKLYSPILQPLTSQIERMEKRDVNTRFGH